MTSENAVIETEMTQVTPTGENIFAKENLEFDSRNATLSSADGETCEELPPVTYIDFIPECFGSKIQGVDPGYAEFQSVVEKANFWLQSAPQFKAVKCETIEFKLNPKDFSLDVDTCLNHVSSCGKNIYLKCLRLWLMPRTDQSEQVQKLAYITVLPDHSSGNLKSTLASIATNSLFRLSSDPPFPSFDLMPTTIEKLNRHLQQKPLPGKILTVESVPFKVVETETLEKLDTESTLWSESGRHSRMYLFAIRIFYFVGQPAFEKIGYHDDVPDIAQSPDGLSLKLKFAPFTNIVSSTATWLQSQSNIRVVNFQSLTLKVEKSAGNGPYVIDPSVAGYSEAQSLQETRFVKILRTFYVKTAKSDVQGSLETDKLTTRLFVPVKRSWKVFESFSKTFQRVIQWCSATNAPIWGMETVRYPISPDGDTVVSEDRVDAVVNNHSGQHYITCIRLYFSRHVPEPLPEVTPTTAEDEAGWACILS